MEQAKAIAQRLSIDDFKASNGWLQKWKTSHYLKCRTVSGESGEVSVITTQSWKEHLPEIMEGYDEKNILYMDETGCFWKALPEKGVAEKGKVCKGGKKSKLRLNNCSMEIKKKPGVLGELISITCLFFTSISLRHG